MIIGTIIPTIPARENGIIILSLLSLILIGLIGRDASRSAVGRTGGN